MTNMQKYISNMEEYNVPVGVRNGYGYIEILIVSFIPEARKKTAHLLHWGILCFVFMLFVSLSINPMWQHRLCTPACEKPAKGKIKMTFIT